MFGRALNANVGKVLGTLLVIGIAGSTVSYGTFATFTAQTSNTGNTFSTGTLALNNVTQSQSTCFTTVSVADNVNANCGSIIALSGSPGLAPGGTIQTGEVGIYNTGTLPITSLSLFADACGYTVNTVVTSTQRGSGNPCPYVNISVARGATCITAVCPPASTTTLGNFPTSTAAGRNALVGLTTLAAGTGATYTFSIQLDSTAPNSVQGTVATTTFHWLAS